MDQRWQRLARRVDAVPDRFGVLLVLLIGTFIALGSVQHTWVRVLAAVLQFAALVVGVLVTDLPFDRRLAALGLTGVLALVLAPSTGDVASGIGELAAFVVFAALVVAVLGRLVKHERVTVQTLLGAVCAYFLIGLAFGAVYGALNDLGDAPLFGNPVQRSVFSYFSFTTLTTIGFGDYTAVTDFGRRIAVVEGMVGQVFVATLLARLVSLYGSEETGRRHPAPDSNR